MAAVVSDGVLYIKSQHSVADTIVRAKHQLAYHQLRVFGNVDYQKEAKKVGRKVPPTQLLLFGKIPLAVELMKANPLVGLDLPLKLLVWEDGNGSVWISYNQAEYLAGRHRGMTTELTQQIKKLMRQVAETAAK